MDWPEKAAPLRASPGEMLPQLHRFPPPCPCSGLIGDHAVIAAGSVVNGKIPARSVAAGIPARVVKTFDAPDGWVRI